MQQQHPGQPPQQQVPQQHSQPAHPQPAQQQRVQARAPHGSSASPVDSEVLYQGIARPTSQYGGYLKWFGASIVGGAVAYGLGLIEFFSTWPLWVLGLVGLPGMFWTFLRYRTTHFKVSLRRVEYEHGVLSKSVESLELWRVLDVRFNQNLIDRMLGNAKVTLVSTDQSDPELVLYGLPNARKLFEELREAVQTARHGNRPMEMVGAEGMLEHFEPQ